MTACSGFLVDASGDSVSRVKVVGFDHVVVNSADVERSLAWYCDELGLEAVRVDEWRRGEVLFPSVRVSRETIIPCPDTKAH